MFIILIVLFEAVRILIGMEMASVMIQTTMKLAFLTVEIAVDLMSIQIIAMNAYALMTEEEEEAVELQHLLELQVAEAAIRI